MSNPSKRKGDRAEREALALYRAVGFPGAERTRPGRREDEGDIHLAPGVIGQVKDCRDLRWREWLVELRTQELAARADTGVLLVRRPGNAQHPAVWLAVMGITEHAELLRAAGYGTPLEEDS